MKFSFNEEQLEKLLGYAFIGYQVVAGNKDLRDESTAEDEEFINELYAQAYEAGSDLVESYKDEYIPIEEFEVDLLAELEEYEEDITFENLSEWLALRDAQEDYTAEEMEDMPENEFDDLIEEYSDAYAEEFSEFGVENLYLTD